MADNFLEKQYATYQEQKSLQQQAARRAWQKKLKEYQKKLAAQKATQNCDKDTPTNP